MLREIVFAMTIVLSVTIVCSDPTALRELNNRRNVDEDSVLSLDITQGLEVGTVLLAIKNQFKEIIGDIISEACRFVKNILFQFKMNLLKKFEDYTLSNLLRVIINGLTDTTLDFDPELSFDANMEVVEPVQVEPVQVETYNNYRNPYSSGLTSLFKDHRN